MIVTFTTEVSGEPGPGQAPADQLRDGLAKPQSQPGSQVCRLTFVSLTIRESRATT